MAGLSIDHALVRSLAKQGFVNMLTDAFHLNKCKVGVSRVAAILPVVIFTINNMQSFVLGEVESDFSNLQPGTSHCGVVLIFLAIESFYCFVINMQ